MTLKTLKAKGLVLSDGSVKTPGYLSLKGDKILSLEPFHEKPNIDLSNMIVFPGFVNAHCHLELTLLGSLARKPFTEWVQTLESSLTTQKICFIESVLNGQKKLMASGTTTVIDHFSPWTPLKAYQNNLINIIAFGEVLGTHIDVAQKTFAIQKDNQKKSPVDFLVTPHAIYSLHQKILKQILNEKSSYSIHISESEDEKIYFENKNGSLKNFINSKNGEQTYDADSALQTLWHHNLELKNSLIVHGNDLTQKEIAHLQKNKNCIVHCPGSFDFFQHKNFPLEKLLQENIKIALGTDSLASNSDLSMLHEIQLFLKNFPEIGFSKLLPMITSNAPETLGYKNIGKISEGFFADLIGFRSKDSETPLQILKSRSKADFVMCQGNALIQTQH